MKDLKVILPLHKAKNIAHNLNTARGLISKVYINPNFKSAILSYMDEVIMTLQDEVRLTEKKGVPV